MDQGFEVMLRLLGGAGKDGPELVVGELKLVGDSTRKMGLDVLTRSRIGVIILATVLCLAACGPSREEQQQALAADLGVKIEDYPYPSVFPIGYFQEELLPGRQVDEVHALVRQYDKVLRCEKQRISEIYYFFGTGDKSALRMEVHYDTHWKVVRIDSEDSNSRTISTEYCEPGRLGPVD